MEDKGVVLISGVNSYLGAHAAAAFLEAGYSVRGTVRVATPDLDPLYVALEEHAKADRFNIVEVPDIAVPGAFDDVVKGVVAVHHVASPVTFEVGSPELALHVTIEATKSILFSALEKAGPQLESVVLMSSIVAIMGMEEPDGKPLTENDWSETSMEVVKKLGLETPPYGIYCATKAEGEKAFWKFKEDKKPPFAMTAVNPAICDGPPVYRPPLNKLTPTIKMVYDLLHGGDILPYQPLLSSFVDARDVSRMTLWAVENASVADGQRYILNGGWGGLQAVADALRKLYPERSDIIQKGTPGEGYLPNYVAKGIDASKAVQASGQEWIGFEQSVKDSAEAFLAWGDR